MYYYIITSFKYPSSGRIFSIIVYTNTAIRKLHGTSRPTTQKKLLFCMHSKYCKRKYTFSKAVVSVFVPIKFTAWGAGAGEGYSEYDCWGSELESKTPVASCFHPHISRHHCAPGVLSISAESICKRKTQLPGARLRYTIYAARLYMPR